MDYEAGYKVMHRLLTDVIASLQAYGLDIKEVKLCHCLQLIVQHGQEACRTERAENGESAASRSKTS